MSVQTEFEGFPVATRRGRGVDFEHRFNTSRWAEDILHDALNACDGLFAFRLGLSQVSEDNRPAATDPGIKIPDLLVFEKDVLSSAEIALLSGIDLTRMGVREVDDRSDLSSILRRARCAIEVEFSPYRASEMKGRNWQCKSPEELARRPRRRAEPPVAPNIWVKMEDLAPLRAWEARFQVPIVITHLFDQEGFAIELSALADFDAEFAKSGGREVELQLTRGIFKKSQTYDRVDAQGARETKLVFVASPAATTPIGNVEDVVVAAQLGISASKKYVAHVLFSGGRITLSEDYLKLIRSAQYSAP